MAATTDEQDVLDLHQQFLEANVRIDSAWLADHVAGDDLLWFNLNKSNYTSGKHICQLWDFLASVAAGATQHCTDSEVTCEVHGDIAFVEYQLHLEANFGVMGNVDQHARGTEIWVRKDDGDWLLRHFHCSEHESGGWEGGV